MEKVPKWLNKGALMKVFGCISEKLSGFFFKIIGFAQKAHAHKLS
jgi:hypothetical protein